MKNQIIEFDVANTLKKEGVSGIFFEGPIVCINYKSRLISFKVDKGSQSTTVERFDNLSCLLDQPTKNKIKLCIAANWQIVLTCRTEDPLHRLELECLEINQQEHIARLDRVYGFNNNPVQPTISSLRKPSVYSKIFTTYVTLEENIIKEVL
jgi:hypothetical protein